MDDRFANSRRFYENQVKPLIEEKFPQYAGRIAVGIAGEGSEPNLLNTNDGIVHVAEQIGGFIAGNLKAHGLVRRPDPYLERHVDEILSDM